MSKKKASNTNLAQDARAKIQTGPGVPQWSWRLVTFSWNGSRAGKPAGAPDPHFARDGACADNLTRAFGMLALAAILLDARRWGRFVSGRQGKGCRGCVGGCGVSDACGTCRHSDA